LIIDRQLPGDVIVGKQHHMRKRVTPGAIVRCQEEKALKKTEKRKPWEM